MKKDDIKKLSIMQKTLVFAIRCYKSSLGLFLGGQCRFVPSCSQYAIEAISEFGVIKGSYMAFKRILCCNPFGSKGFDPPDMDFKKK